MSEQPEAPRMADALDDPRMVVFFDHRSKAVAELRRLHAECEHHKAWVAHITAENKSLEAQRDALLEFAKYVEAIDPNNPAPLFEKARAAIKAAEGENT